MGPMREAGEGRWKEEHLHPSPARGFPLSLRGLALHEGVAPEDK